jgi:AraC-like DNA-binding protein
MTAPWGFRVQRRDVASFHLVVEGRCWLDVDGLDGALPLVAGDLVVLPGGHAHQLRDSPTSAATDLVEILADHPLSEGARLSYGNGGERTDLLCGGFVVESPDPQVLRAALPPVVHVAGQRGRAVEWLAALLKLLNDELASRTPGAEVVVARLSDVLLTKVLGACLAQGGRSAASAAARDPQIATALRLIHECPDGDWTVEALASQVALSRSAFAARFRRLTGCSPMRYVARVRMRRAADYLRGSRKSLDEIARLTGYESDVALSKAFRRHFGASPGLFRRTPHPHEAAEEALVG